MPKKREEPFGGSSSPHPASNVPVSFKQLASPIGTGGEAL